MAPRDHGLMDELLIAFVLAATAMTALWAWQLKSNRADWVDAAWAASIGCLAMLFAVLGDGALEKRILAVVVAGTWSARLTLHMVTRLLSHDDEDGRYQALRAHWAPRVNLRMWLFFMAQASVAFLFALPAWVVAQDPSAALDWAVFAGVGVWLISLAGESLADQQLARFRADPTNKGQVCDVGLWRYSRHPNYFFEWLHWFSYPLIAFGTPLSWIAWLGPVVMVIFLYRITGIPYTEKQALKSRGERYREYQRTTSPFVPWKKKRA